MAGLVLMSETSDSTNAAREKRDRLIYIRQRLKELKEERLRLIEERDRLKSVG